MIIFRYPFLLLSGILMLAGCSDNKSYETAICALADVSGTYAQEKGSMVQIIKTGLIPKMVPGDGFYFIAIDSNSYAEDNLITKVTLDYRPSEVVKQKMAFSKTLDQFAADDLKSDYTDISGAMMLCADYLKASKAGYRLMFVFSDMKEELPSGLTRVFEADEFSGIDIAAMNVIKLDKDSANPQIYRDRLKDWNKKLNEAGAKSWTNLMDAAKIPEFIESVKS